MFIYYFFKSNMHPKLNVGKVQLANFLLWNQTYSVTYWNFKCKQVIWESRLHISASINNDFSFNIGGWVGKIIFLRQHGFKKVAWLMRYYQPVLDHFSCSPSPHDARPSLTLSLISSISVNHKNEWPFSLSIFFSQTFLPFKLSSFLSLFIFDLSLCKI